MLSYPRIMHRFPGLRELFCYGPIAQTRLISVLLPSAPHLFGHSPDSANAWDYHPPTRWEEKTVDARGLCVPLLARTLHMHAHSLICSVQRLLLVLLPNPHDRHAGAQERRLHLHPVALTSRSACSLSSLAQYWLLI